ncbi:MAG: sortase [Oscillospiraceae bacterium]|nr:sortase [Oscillospiraceae bacterium]
MRNKKILAYGFLLFGTAAVLLACALFLHNRLEDRKASRQAQIILEKLHTELDNTSAVNESITAQPGESDLYIPDYMLNPNMDMPAIEIDGDRYIGYLQFPTLSLELPIMRSWSYPDLKVAPCLYAGSIYTGNAVIAAHNYTSHFGPLYNLKPGDPVRFTDVDGNVFSYEVVTQEVLEATAIEDMTSSSFALSLFTCTYGGASRYTVRCEAL